MDRFDSMMAFVTAVDEGSLAAAARRLRHSPAAVTRSIAALEERLGTRLLHRTTRALRLTQAGSDYLQVCRHVLRELEAAEMGASTEHSLPRGLLTVAAPALLGRLSLRPLLDRFLDANPLVQGRLILVDRIVHLVDEGIDVAIHAGELPDSGLHATSLGEVRRVVCASPAYLERHGVPGTPGDLSSHVCIVATDPSGGETWSFRPAPDRGSRLQSVALKPRLAVNGAAAAIDSVLEGRGISRMMASQIRAELEAGALVLLLSRYEPPPVPVHLVFAEARQASAKVRAFIDFAVPTLRAEMRRTAQITAAAAVAAVDRGPGA